MSGVTEDTPLGLAAAARVVGDPRVTVTSLREAIASGRLAATEDALIHGRKMVTVSAVRAMLEAGEQKASEPAPEAAPEPAPEPAAEEAPAHEEPADQQEEATADEDASSPSKKISIRKK